MAHVAYTTYLSKMKDIPKDTQIIIIMRAAPMSVQKYENLTILKDLAPYGAVLMEYKKTGDIDKLKEAYYKQITEDETAKDLIELAMHTLDNYNSIAFVCCEKDYTTCHRSILGNYLTKLGYNIKEIGVDGSYGS